MEAPEVPTEHLHEHLEHAAEHGGEKWISWVAVSTAIFAALAAVASLLAGEHVNEAIVKKMESNDKWGEFGVKSMKGDLAQLKADLLSELGKSEAGAAATEKTKKYEEKKNELQDEAKALGKESEHHLHIHEKLARTVTLCQIAIAIAAISALTRRKPFWFVSLAFGIAGAVFLATSLLPAGAAHH
jgi:hypothetical protein